MKVSLDWIRELLPTLKQSADGIARRLTEVGVEVEGTFRQADALEGVRVAEVRALVRHPEADRLQIATVFDGEQELQVVCGAPNVAAGQKVAFAPVGTRLPDGKLIEAKAIRGVSSAGMLCSAEELGLSDDHDGLLVLRPRAKPGRKVSAALGRTDVILDLSITPNRPDLLSHYGLARELAAVYRLSLAAPLRGRVKETGQPASTRAKVEVKAGPRCPRYLARVITGLKVGPSPDWLVARLAALGQRSISNVVDATNLVLLELGHPLHAFDLDRLEGQRVQVRLAREGERLTTLDGVDRALDPDDLVIADANRAVALAGVIGGANSEVGPETSAILLESAYFEPRGVRRTARRHGLHTEASHRFERGTDPEVLEDAIDRVALLIVELAGGEIAQGRLEVQKRDPERKVVAIRPERASALLGREVDKQEIRTVLAALGLKKSAAPKAPRGAKKTPPLAAAAYFEVPSFRIDLNEEVDLIEEVARISGYDSIPVAMPPMSGPLPDFTFREAKEDRVRDVLVAEGCFELISLAFSAPAGLELFGLPAEHAVQVQNPLGEESSRLRMALLPGLLKAAAHNQAYGAGEQLRLFEVGRTFRWDDPPGELPSETAGLAFVLRGRREAEQWNTRPDPVDAYDAKALIERLAHAFGLERRLVFAPVEQPILHPRSATCVTLAEPDGPELGVFGELHPDLAQKLGLEGPALFVAELSLEVFPAEVAPRTFHALPRFPSVDRDLSFFVGRDRPAQSVLERLEHEAGPHLEQIRVFDVYEGQGVPEGQRSLALAFRFRAEDRTLTESEVDQTQNHLIAVLENELGARVRKA